jgi:hypothetical protein
VPRFFSVSPEYTISAVSKYFKKFADIFEAQGANLPPISSTQEEALAKFAGGVVDTGGKSVTGVVDTIDKFATSVVDTGGAPPRIKKKIEMTLILFSGACGKMIHEKNLKQKIS